MKFKKGDLVRCVDSSQQFRLKKNKLYIVKSCEEKFVDLGCLNFKYKTNGFFLNRFIKVSSTDLTEDEKFRYIKYKLGAKID